MADYVLTRMDLMTQLRAEIGAKFNGNVTAFAKHAGINRSQMEKYLSGSTEIGTDKLMISIAALGLTPSDFFASAMARALRH